MAVATIGNVVVMRWRGAVGPAEIDEIKQATLRCAQPYPKGVGHLSLIDLSGGASGLDDRRAARRWISSGRPGST